MNAPLSNMASLPHVLPELVLVAGILLVIVWDLAAPRRPGGVVALALATLAGSAATAVLGALRHPAPLALFGGLLNQDPNATGLLVADPYAHYFRVFFALATAAVVLLAAPQPMAGGGAARGRGAGEFFALLLCVTLGLDLMAMSRNLLMIYLSLELVSVISFVLAGFASERPSSGEAALKYVIFGGFSSGVMLYGMSWLFGMSGSLDLPAIAAVVLDPARAHGLAGALFLAVICVIAGFGYKISAVPFHMWAPDVYEGAPTPITAFLSVGPKAAGFAVMLRFFHDTLHAGLGAGTQMPWALVGGILALLTMTAGNLAALGQQSVKRLLAYSSIAHAGYMLLGFTAFSGAGIAAVIFYITVYGVMNLGAFLVVQAVEEREGSDRLDRFAGLGRRAPGLAIAMAVFLFSLTGLPPMAGFIGKFYLFAALLEQPTSWHIVLAVVGVLNSVVALFYYARILRAMFLSPAREGAEGALAVRPLYGWTAAALAVPTIVLGLYWSPVYSLVTRALVMAP